MTAPVGGLFVAQCNQSAPISVSIASVETHPIRICNAEYQYV